MRFDIISAVPDTMSSYINSSIIKNAQDKNKVEIFLHDLHDYSSNKHKKIDDYPFGGGSGMLIQCEPVFNLVNKLKSVRDYDEVIYTSADGQIYNQDSANQLSLKNNIIIIAGHYKGIDQRIRDELVTMEISVGDFILTGGELPSLLILDSVVRLLPGVLGDSEAAMTDSFMNGLLEEPQYTRPANFQGLEIPQVLLSGNHQAIADWRQEQQILKTKRLRPDLLK
jgi:tRNA (guanine37-N1)-methyltransferase